MAQIVESEILELSLLSGFPPRFLKIEISGSVIASGRFIFGPWVHKYSVVINAANRLEPLKLIDNLRD